MPAADPPEDFAAFWKSKLDELAKVPPNPKLQQADGGKAGVEYAKITLDNIRGAHINGQLARPEHGEKFPALLIVQWAGVYPLQKGWVTDRAADGWLALAREQMERGEWRLALRALYLATLARLAGEGLISLATFKTNLDYEREVRRRALSRAEVVTRFAARRREFEAVWYGREHPGESHVRAWMAELERPIAE